MSGAGGRGGGGRELGLPPRRPGPLVQFAMSYGEEIEATVLSGKLHYNAGKVYDCRHEGTIWRPKLSFTVLMHTSSLKRLARLPNTFQKNSAAPRMYAAPKTYLIASEPCAGLYCMQICQGKLWMPKVFGQQDENPALESW